MEIKLMTDPADLTIEVKKCNDSGVFFYQVLDDVHALNGDVVSDVSIESGDATIECPADSVKMSCSFADDEHFVTFK